MRAVLQRVRWARVRVEDETVGEIGPGLLVLVAMEKRDEPEALDWMARKIAELRIFADEEGKMNLSVEEQGGAVLVVSQFTLAARVKKGRRPSYTDAAPPLLAERQVSDLADRLRERGISVEEGRFGASMEVELLNDGPVTIVLER